MFDDLNLDTLPPSTFADRVLIPVPWNQADVLNLRLRKQGICSTAFYDPATKTASLEVPRDVDLRALRTTLAG